MQFDSRVPVRNRCALQRAHVVDMTPRNHLVLMGPGTRAFSVDSHTPNTFSLANFQSADLAKRGIQAPSRLKRGRP